MQESCWGQGAWSGTDTSGVLPAFASWKTCPAWISVLSAIIANEGNTGTDVITSATTTATMREILVNRDMDII